MSGYTRNELDKRRRARAERRKLACQIAADTNLDVRMVDKVLEIVAQLACQMLRERDVFLLHKIVRLRMKRRSSRKETLKNICGHEIILRALPMRKVLVCGVTRGLTAELK